MNDATTIENERLMQLQEERLKDETSKSSTAKTATPLSFFKKISKHWLILITAVFFDILALIPFVNIAFNLCFGGILFLYFSGKSGKEKKLLGKIASGKSLQSEFIKIGLPVGIGSIADFFFSILPVNLGTALIRIALS
jgi:hypothetical protein